MGNPSSSSSPLLLLPPPNNSSNPPSPTTLKTPNPEPAPAPAPAPPDSSSPPSQSQSQSQKKPTPLPWTHQETLNLIQSYQEKWYSLKKGQLKAHQWEDVASSVAARCGYDEPYKTATQCRHKIEKLRKRYRTERNKAYPNSWLYFELMDRMERGPLPISSARPVSAAAPVEYRNLNSGGSYNETDSEDDDVDYGPVDVKKKSINHIVRGDLGLSSNINGRGGGNHNQRGMRSLRTPVTMKRKGYYENNVSDEEEMENDEEEDEEEKEGDGGMELAAAIRGFAESFMRMENKKIEMMRATESYRMEMEKKRMDMILESQRKIVDTIGKAIGTHKKLKMDQDI